MENQPPVNATSHDSDNKHRETSTTGSDHPATAETSNNSSSSNAVESTKNVDTPSETAAGQEKEQGQDQKQKQRKSDDAGEDEDSEMDELDDVLDDFSKPSASGKQDPPSQSQPAPPSTSTADNDESAFMSQLEKDMANMMSQAANETGVADQEGFENAVDQGAEYFAKKLENSGIPPGELLKQLLSDVAAEESRGGASSAGDVAVAAAAAGGTSSSGAATAPSSSKQGQSSNSNNNTSTANAKSGTSTPPESFNDAIQRTINRMKESGDKATAAATEDDVSDDLLAQLLKAVEAGEGADEGELGKLISGMMEQLSNKEMLYEPMKDLDTKFGPWIAQNRERISKDDLSRYEQQATYVSQIVAKFEEPGFTDEDAGCRGFIWDKMQAMQAAGSPPEELVSNPWNSMLDDALGGGSGGGGGDAGGNNVPDCPQQ